MVNVLVEIAFVQGEFATVRVNVTLPLLISAALGVYVAVFNEPCVPLKEPVPLELHVVVVKLDAVASDEIFVPVAVEHIDKAAPAEAVGVCLTVMVIVVFSCAEQLVEVIVARILNVVVAERDPVGNVMLPPVPATEFPMSVLSALFLN